MSTTAAAAPAKGAEEAAEKKGGRKKMLMIVVLLVVVLAAGGWWFLLKPASAAAKPQPGAVIPLDAIQVNLAGDHYLRIGIALQASKDAGTDLDGSKALDATIEEFTGQPMRKLAHTPYRQKLKRELVHQLSKQYDGQVIGVYFTDFVTQ